MKDSRVVTRPAALATRVLVNTVTAPGSTYVVTERGVRTVPVLRRVVVTRDGGIQTVVRTRPGRTLTSVVTDHRTVTNERVLTSERVVTHDRVVTQTVPVTVRSTDTIVRTETVPIIVVATIRRTETVPVIVVVTVPVTVTVTVGKG